MNEKQNYAAIESALSRYEIYKAGFKYMTAVAISLVVLSAVAICVAWWALAQQPEPRYFAAREDGGIIPLVATDQPYLNPGQLINFASEAVRASYSYNFANYREDQADASKFYEQPDGWKNYLVAMKQSGMLDMIINRRLVSTVETGGAVIVSSGPDQSGRYSWVVQVPMTITYQSASERSTEKRTAELKIVRVPTWKSPYGVGIRQIIVK